MKVLPEHVVADPAISSWPVLLSRLLPSPSHHGPIASGEPDANLCGARVHDIEAVPGTVQPRADNDGWRGLPSSDVLAQRSAGVAGALCSLLEVGSIAARVGHDLAIRHVAAMVLRRTSEGAMLSQCGPDCVSARLIGQPRLAHERHDIALEVRRF